RRAGDDGDAPGQEGQLPLASFGEEPFRLEAGLELLEGDLQRARADRLDRVADQLVLALGLVDVEVAAGHPRMAVLQLELEPPRLVAEEDGREAGVAVLQGEVEVARARHLEVRDLAAHPDVEEAPSQDALDLAGQFGDGVDALPRWRRRRGPR